MARHSDFVLVLMVLLAWAVCGAPSKALILPVWICAVALLRRPATRCRHNSRSVFAQMLVVVMRGLELVCRMVPTFWLHVMFLSVSVYPAQAARLKPSDDDESKDAFKKRMNEAGTFFTYLGLAYYLLPIVSFEVTEDWKRVFFDCFTPFSLWLDSVHCICDLVVTLFFIKKLGDRFGALLSEFVGLFVSFYSIYHYLTLKLMEVNQNPNDPHPQMTPATAKRHITCIVMVAMVFTAVVILQLDNKWYIPDYRTPVDWLLDGFVYVCTVMACLCESAQIGYAIYHRIGTAWEDDDRPIFWLKIISAACALLTDGFDSFNQLKVEVYWDEGNFTRCAVVMSAFSAFCSALLIVGRSIGPSNFKKAGDSIAQRAAAVKIWKDETIKSVIEWAKALGPRLSSGTAQVLQRLSDELAQALERWMSR